MESSYSDQGVDAMLRFLGAADLLIPTDPT